MPNASASSDRSLTRSTRSADVVVIGAGVAGLLTAVRVADAGREVQVLDARDRVGGRCQTVTLGGVPVDLGAAWHWEEHDRVPGLLEELGLERIRQHEPGTAVFEARRTGPVQHFEWPETPPPSWRVAGGLQSVASALADQLDPDQLRLGHRVTSLRREEGGVRIGVGGVEESIRAGMVVCAIPPHLAAHTVAFEPALPDRLERALRQTPTWMGHSMKAAAAYERPFWREAGLAGRVRSLVGPVNDWHDATPPGHLDASTGTVQGPGALFGFGAPPATGASDDSMREAIVEQLVHCFGVEAADPLGVAWTDWTRERATTPPSGSTCRGEEPRAAPPLSDSWWDGRLHFAAAETAHDHPGFLDGAIEAAERTAHSIE